jgi:RNAse (barnase) inhibitor barstar
MVTTIQRWYYYFLTPIVLTPIVLRQISSFNIDITTFGFPKHKAMNMDGIPDVLLSSLIGSNVNLKWKQRKNKKLGTRSLIRNTLGVEGRARAPGWD